MLQKIDEAITAVTAAAGGAPSTLLDALNDAKANFQAAVSNATSIAQIDLSKLLKAFYGLKDAITAAATDLAAPAFADAKTKLEAARDLFAQKFPGRLRFNYDSTNKVVTVGFDFSLAKSITQSLDFASAANLADFLPITLKSNGEFTLDVGADLTLDVGLDLKNRQFFFQESTALALKARIDAAITDTGVSIAGIPVVTLGPTTGGDNAPGSLA